jgi:hypothetical protein
MLRCQKLLFLFTFYLNLKSNLKKQIKIQLYVILGLLLYGTMLRSDEVFSVLFVHILLVKKY